MDTGRDVQDKEGRENDLCSGTAACSRKGLYKTNKFLTEVTNQ